MQKFQCDCGNRLFFENTHCLSCGSEVGWCPNCASMTALVFSDPGVHCGRCKSELWKCANRVDHEVCNRSIPAPAGSGAGGMLLCDCCSYNDTIPDLTVDGNLERWRTLEQAKRRLIHGLDSLGLPHRPASAGNTGGLAFDFKADAIAARNFWRPVGEQDIVYTGHADGKITINIREADTVEREKLRVDLGEGHRTLIGHFRHEIGHYYWDVLIKPVEERVTGFKKLFGDHQNPTYEEALDRHYKNGPRDDWQSGYVSAYATMHPWEDWAETFAFYLDIVDVMETAAASGLIVPPAKGDLDALVETYVRLGLLMNELNRALGLIDFLPELVVPPVVEKLRFVHDAVHASRMVAA